MVDIRARQVGSAQVPPPERPSGVTLIALYEFATAAILLLMSCAILFFALPALMFTATTPAGVIRALVVLLLLLGCGLAFSGASAVIGWGLFKMWPWARVGAMVLAIPALLGFPIWTVAAVIVLIYLGSNEGRAAFAAAEAAARVGPPPSWPPASTPAYPAPTTGAPEVSQRQEEPPSAPTATASPSPAPSSSTIEETRRMTTEKGE